MALTGRGVNSGTGINVLVDSGVDGDMQMMKLAISAAGSQIPIPADATNGLRVGVAAGGVADGGIVALGSTTSAAVTNPATNASLIAYVRGLLSGIGAAADAAVTSPASSASVIALLKGLLTGGGAIADAAVTNPASSGSSIALLKGVLTRLSVGAASILKAEDAAHVDGDAGVMALAVRKDTVAVSSGATGDYEPLQTDSLGRLRIADNRVGTLSNSTSTAIEATRVVKASAGVLYGVQGYAAAAGFVWICNKASAPNGTSDNLVIPIYVAAAGPFSIDFGRYGRAFSTGIALGFSSNSAPASWTSSTNAWFDAQFE